MTSPPALQPRHIAVLTAFAIGLTAQAAERHLHISTRTMRRAVAEAADILGANSTTHAVALAVAGGHIDPDHLRDRTLPAISREDISRAWAANRVASA